MSIELAVETKRQHADYLLKKRNVVACGVGYKVTQEGPTDEPAVVVGVTKKMPVAQLAEADLVPKTINAVKTDVVEVGVLRAFQSPTDRWRPAPGGVSIGHTAVTAGTLGCLVVRGDEVFILSNNHVLANVNDCQKGDSILQPGRYDGGTADDCIATLEEWVPIDFGAGPPTCPWASTIEQMLNATAKALGSDHRITAFRESPGINRVDCALARPLSPEVVERRISHIGVPKGSREATLGTPVKKSGRTTSFTVGQITQIDVTAQVAYGNRVATFEDQLVAGAMSAGGDSGSAVLDEEGYVIGLLFAGSDTTTIINPIGLVLDALQVSIAT